MGTEHLLLALMGEQDCQAAKILANLGLEIDKVRHTIEATLGRNERPIVQQIIPTSRVQSVFKIAFEESKSQGVTYVGTEHLLIGLLIEGEGLAFHVLEELAALPLDPEAPTPEQPVPHRRLRDSTGWTSYAPLQGRTVL
ncbi:MAG: Clp protease N-terminal domain-containing protein [Candidatus Dormibacteria bacterium]